jgi:hypothetical protein
LTRHDPITQTGGETFHLPSLKNNLAGSIAKILRVFGYCGGKMASTQTPASTLPGVFLGVFMPPQ